MLEACDGIHILELFTAIAAFFAAMAALRVTGTISLARNETDQRNTKRLRWLYSQMETSEGMKLIEEEVSKIQGRIEKGEVKDFERLMNNWIRNTS